MPFAPDRGNRHRQDGSRCHDVALAAEESSVAQRLLAGGRLSLCQMGADLSRRLLLAAVAVPG